MDNALQRKKWTKKIEKGELIVKVCMPVLSESNLLESNQMGLKWVVLGGSQDSQSWANLSGL